MKRLRLKHVISILVLVFLGALPGRAQPAAGKGLPVWDQFARHISEICARVKPAVVHIEVISRQGSSRRKSLGSGLVVASEGKIVTNFHVIDHAESIFVLLDDGSKYPASVLRKDKATDLAVLQIHAHTPLPKLDLGDSDKAEVGEWVLAVGNPFGFDRTVSLGILSGKRRFLNDSDGDFRPLNDFLQTDASIDPGSSGGPLVNLRGEVIGINSVGIGRGQGFTIPSKTIRDVLEGSQVQGQLERGWLGLYPQPLTRELRAYWGLRQKGLLVSDVAPQSPAEQAGLHSGDIVTRLNGNPLDSEKEEDIQLFAQSISRLAPGSRIDLEVWHAGELRTMHLTLGQQPPEQGREVDAAFGATFSEVTLNDQLQYRLPSSRGVVVRSVNPSSPAQWAGLSAGDLVLECDSTPVKDLDHLEAMLKARGSKRPVLLKLRQGKLIRYSLVEPTAQP